MPTNQPDKEFKVVSRKARFGPQLTNEQQMETLRKLIAKTTDERLLAICKAKLKDYEERQK